MQHTQPTTARSPRRRRPSMGFTLVEVLIAFGIFAIGMIAVASLFPVAALLQKETANDILGKDAAESAKAIVLAKGLTYQPSVADRATNPGDLDNYYSIAGANNSHAVPLFQVDVALENRFTIWDRSYPSFTPTIEDRDLFWVPFIQDVGGDPNNPVWVMHLFVLNRDSRADWDKTSGTWANPSDVSAIPGVIGAACTIVAGSGDTALNIPGHEIQAGDRILDNNGIAYLVKEIDGNEVTINGVILTSPADPNTVWYAPPGAGGDGNSPTLNIITFTSDPNDPEAVQLVSDPTP